MHIKQRTVEVEQSYTKTNGGIYMKQLRQDKVLGKQFMNLLVTMSKQAEATKCFCSGCQENLHEYL